MRQLFILYSIISVLAIVLLSSFRPVFLWGFILLLPLILIGIYDLIQTKHTLWRNFLLIARWRWIMEALRVPMQQYFIESDNTVHQPTVCSVPLFINVQKSS